MATNIDMMLTAEQLHLMLPRASDKNVKLYLGPLNTAMEKFEISTPLRIAAFIAQLGHESGSLYYVEELADGSAYEYRKDLGNLEEAALTAAHSNKSTTGKWFKGHGLFQITGYYNHKLCGDALGLDLVNNPRQLCDPEYATLSAAWFWDLHKLNIQADSEAFGKITKTINGGFNGAAQRIALYSNCKKVLQCDMSQGLPS